MSFRRRRSKKALLKYRRPRHRLSRFVAPRKFRPGFSRTSGLYATNRQHAGELKFFDTDVPAAQFPLGPGGNHIQPLIIGIPQGTTRSSRVGQKIRVVRVQAQFSFQLQPTGSSEGDNFVRIALITDKQANGTQALETDFYTNGGAEVTTMQMLNVANLQRFNHPWSKVLGINANGSGVSVLHKTTYLRVDKRVNIPVFYSGTTGSVTEIRSNHIFFFLKAFVNTSMFFNAKYRVWYRDEN